ncbi:type VI secretion system tip protein VgrG [Roseomonas terrae]|uniref:Type VI secretion system tip protein VgrG n=1 Tax=Neoroseomonas terrae TaxID=424799 RepID=A0ABS5EL98_9PROT|nr:type VI secretion system tip protein VgrG [Neoroseomonas terrae]
MTTTYDQTDRILAMQSAKLGTDKAVLTRLHGRDALCRPFEMSISFATAEPVDAVKSMLGEAVTLEFGIPHAEGELASLYARRPFHGIVRNLARGRMRHEGEYEWHAEIVPEVWFLSLDSDCRIFQNASIPQIIREVLARHKVTHRSRVAEDDFPKLEFCVQYRESTLDFITRLMEQAGLFYWHQHTASSHTLMLSDMNSDCRDMNRPAIPISRDGGSIRRLDEHFEFRTGDWQVRDHSMLNPVDAVVAESRAAGTRSVRKMSSHKRIEYPGRYQAEYHGGTDTLPKVDTQDATKRADLLIAVEEAGFHRRIGDSGLAGFDAGSRITLEGPPVEKLLVTAVTHKGQDYSHWSMEAWNDQLDVPPAYDNEFVCIPYATPFRPERTTERPFIQGPQTAIVTGPSGQEIHTDKYGRVKLKFAWDRHGPSNDGSSCWVRVSQGWAGAKWGQIHLPRVGQEVIVNFLEGDPDRPIVTGRVYNQQNEVPYDLPGNKTQSGIKSRSSMQGSSSNYNEIRFEDLKGSEHILVHAERDLITEVENYETHTVGGAAVPKSGNLGSGDRHTGIKRNETLDVGGNNDETIHGTETRKVHGDVDETFLAKETRTITGPFDETVTNAYKISTPSTYELTATTSISLNSSGPILANSGEIINVVAPTVNQAAPSWFKSGAASGDAYGFKMGIAGMKLDIVGLAVGFVGIKFDVAAVKFDNFGVAIKTGGLEIKNKGLKADTYSFAEIKAAVIKIFV